MVLGKKILLSSLLITSIPVFADLYTENYTNEDSSVRVSSGSKHPCSADAGIFTPKVQSDGSPGTSYASNNHIKLLCISSGNNMCNADIFNTKNCTGEMIGRASLDLKTYKVTNAESFGKYDIQFTNQAEGTQLTLKYK